MSDGPHRSLNMHKSWKRLAECADGRIFSIEEVSGAFLPALSRCCADEVPGHLWSKLIEIFGDKQPQMFNEHKTTEISALRMGVGGLPLASILVDCAERSAVNGLYGKDALLDAVTKALEYRAIRSNRQIEEHYYRESNAPRSINVRDRLAQALGASAIGELASQCLSRGVPPKNMRAKKQSGLDEGVSF